VSLTAKPALVEVAPGVRMQAWTFDGSVPGPVIRARQGDVVEVTLRNADRMRHGPAGHRQRMFHSVDFHAAQVAPDVAFANVAPGASRTFAFTADRPGVFLYHCGTNPVLEHLGMGMYGAIVVDPAAGRPPAHEFVLVQSEFYGRVRHGRLISSLRAMRDTAPRVVAFNGRGLRYVRAPLQVKVGEPVRLYVVSAGPSLDSAFHVVGEIFDSVQPSSDPADALHGVSTWSVPPGGGTVFELAFDQPGTYPFVTHALRWAQLGAMGRIVATAPKPQ
jgi:nitrite reductase (NO-forming)